MNRPSLTLAALGLACGLAWIPGCKGARLGGSTPPDRVIADLRDENAQLREEVDRLNLQVEARLAELDAARAAQGGPPPLAAAPRLHQITLAPLSGAVDNDGDGRDDLIRLYVVTRDQHGRFLPVEGRAVVQAVAIEPDQPAQVIADRTFEADQFRGAYRSGLGGTHYTLELQLTSGEPLPASLTVKASVTDAATGVTLAAQREVKIKSKPPSHQ